jgi:hypothetical protein
MQQWIVYEGNVSLEGPIGSTILEQGQKLVAKGPAAVSKEKLTSQDIQEAAKIYATVDASRAKGFNPVTIRPRLQKLYQEVLRDPTNRAKQIELRTEQQSLGITGTAVAAKKPLIVVPKSPLIIVEEPLPPPPLQKSTQNEEIVGLFKRVNEGGGSKDYYNLALALERTKWIGASSAAEFALQLNLVDKHLSNKEQAECKRISGEVSIEKPFTTTQTQKPDIENVVLRPNQKIVHTIKRNNTCTDATILRHSLPKLPFVRLLTGHEIEVRPGDWEMKVEFDTTGMKPGIYQADLSMSCLNCDELKRCVLGDPSIKIHLLVTDDQTGANDKPQE